MTTFAPVALRIGATIRLIRLRQGLRQSEAAARAGVSQSAWSRLERGAIDGVSVGVVRKAIEALDGGLELRIHWRGAELDRLLDEVHARVSGAVIGELERHGWIVRAEVSYSIWGERGSIDIFAWHAPTRTLLVVEVKSELASTEELIRRLDVKVRLGAQIAKRFGWHPGSVERLVVMNDERRNRRAVERHDAVFSAAFPIRGWAVRRWLAAPRGGLSGLWFVTPTRQSGPMRNPSSVRRVRGSSPGRCRTAARSDGALPTAPNGRGPA